MGRVLLALSACISLAIVGAAVASTINGTTGNDKIQGTARADILNGNAGNDRISGFAGDDRINSGQGNDWIDGGDGKDTVVCGPGTDAVQADKLDVVAQNCEFVTRTAPVQIEITPDNFTDDPQVGSWTASGAISDSGRYERIPTGSRAPCYCTVQPEHFKEEFVLTSGSEPTATLTVEAEQAATTEPGTFPKTTGVWRITSGTGIYGRVSGHGTDEFLASTLTLSLLGVIISKN
jgi:hypothetical protein